MKRRSELSMERFNSCRPKFGVRFHIEAKRKPSTGSVLQPDQFYEDGRRKEDNVTPVKDFHENSSSAGIVFSDGGGDGRRKLSRIRQRFSRLEQIDEDENTNNNDSSNTSGEDETEDIIDEDGVSMSTCQEEEESEIFELESLECESDDEGDEYDSTTLASSETERELDEDVEEVLQPYHDYLKRFRKLKQTLENLDKVLVQNPLVSSNNNNNNNGKENGKNLEGHSYVSAAAPAEDRECLQQIFYEFQHLASRHRAGFLGVLADKSSSSSRDGIRRIDEDRSRLASSFSFSSNNPSPSKNFSRLNHYNCQRNSNNDQRSRSSSSNSHLSSIHPKRNSSHNNNIEPDASSSNEAAHLQQRLKNLSSELVTLRNRLHVNNNNNGHSSFNNNNNNNNNNNGPPVPPISSITTTAGTNGNNNISGGIIPLGEKPLRYQQQQQPPLPHHVGSSHGMQYINQTNNIAGESYTNKPLPPHPPGLMSSSNNNGGAGANIPNNPTGAAALSGNNLTSSNGVGSHSNNSNNNNGTGYYVNQQQFPKDVMRANGNSQQGTEMILPTDDKTSGSLVGTGTNTNNSASGGEASPSESSFKLLSSSISGSGSSASKIRLADVEDLIHLYGPLTEDALIRCLQARCAAGKQHIYMGPILLMANSFNAVGNALTLSSTRSIPTPVPIQKVVQEALRQQSDTAYPQAIILSGSSGSGKTYASMLVLRQLFEVAGGGIETDAYKHLMASITVLRSLGTAKTTSNSESSRIGHFVEVQVTDGTVYRTKVHCYFLDQSRVVSVLPGERNYHIFYQMLAGLSPEERGKLHLGDHTVRTLRYLQAASSSSSGGANDRTNDQVEDSRRFLDWKASLGVLGIPFLDVVRVLAAVVLLGNVNFVDSACMEVDVEHGNAELQAAASLLGVSETALKQGLTTRTHNVRNQLVRSRCDANWSNSARDSLAKSLYCRTVATIVRRANSLKRLSSTSGTLSSDSADSVHNQAETQSQHASTVGTAGSKASKSMTALNNAVRHATDGFIGILDMFGFEDVKPSHLEHLCINLCAETMQHFYNTHIFKACIDSCRDEGIQCHWEVEYVDNVPCIDLVSSLRTGLLSMLDVECSVRGTVESYVQKVHQQHNKNPRFIETQSADLRSFSIQHYAGKVCYNATDFLETNRDILADDLVAVFHKHRCSFGFASHLFSSELKVLGAGGIEPSPRGIFFRISPTSHTELLNGNEPVSTLTQDFHTRLDNLLRTLVHARPHFIRCIKINQQEQPNLFDRYTVSKQLRAFQVLETMNLMAHGYPHRMRFKAFSSRYRLLAPFHQLARTEDRALEDSQLILECFDNSIDGSIRERLGHISISWAVGKRHVFMSEGARQQLEALRTACQNRAARLIQSTWRGWRCRRRLPMFQRGHHHRGFHHASIPHNSNSLLPTAPSMSAGGICANQVHLPGQAGASLGAAAAASIFRNGVLVSPNAASALGNLHSMQPHSVSLGTSGGPDSVLRTSELCSSPPPPPPTVPIPAPRTLLANCNNILSNGMAAASPPAVPTLTTASVATIASTGVSGAGGGRPRPQPISGTPPPDVMDRCDPKLVQQTCNLFGLDMERPPPLPPARSYTVAGNTKLSYPQTRVMKMSFPDDSTVADVRLLKGETVVVVGASARRGHLLVEHKNRTIHVPFQYLELKSTHPE